MADYYVDKNGKITKNKKQTPTYRLDKNGIVTELRKNQNKGKSPVLNRKKQNTEIGNQRSFKNFPMDFTADYELKDNEKSSKKKSKTEKRSLKERIMVSSDGSSSNTDKMPKTQTKQDAAFAKVMKEIHRKNQKAEAQKQAVAEAAAAEKQKAFEKEVSDKLSNMTGKKVNLVSQEERAEKHKQVTEEIANRENGWVKKSSGNFGDAIMGTTYDAAENFSAGIASVGEQVIDAVAGIGSLGQRILGNSKKADKIDSFIKKDIIDEKGIINEAFNPNRFSHLMAIREVNRQKELGLEPDYSVFVRNYLTDDYSVLGEKSEGLIQTVGQQTVLRGASQIGVPWQLATGATVYGSSLDQNLNSGATGWEAQFKAGKDVAAEILTESLFKGSGYGEEGLINLGGFTDNIANQTLKKLADYGVDIGGEAIEEVLSAVFSRFGNALYDSIAKGENNWETLYDEAAIDEYIESAISGALVSGIMNVGNLTNSIRTGTDYNTGLTQTEQNVVNKEIENRIAEAKKDGTKIGNKQRANIEQEVLSDLYSGNISIDTIEQALDGDDYTAYKDAVENEKAVLKEYSELKSIKQSDRTLEQKQHLLELEGFIEDIKNQKISNKLKSNLGEKVFDIANGTHLAESYAENARRSEAFTDDVSQYDEKLRPTIQKAIDSGLLNNTNKTHAFIDTLANISADTGHIFDLANTEQINAAGYGVEDRIVNGYITKEGNITINIDSPKVWQSVVGHEVTHKMQKFKNNDALKKVALDYAKAKGDYQAKWDALVETYKTTETDQARLEQEFVADIIGDYVFTDEAFVKHLSTTDQNIFKKVYNEIKHLLKLTTAGSKEYRQLEKVKHTFDKVYSEMVKQNAKAQEAKSQEYEPQFTDAMDDGDSDVRYNISKTQNMPWKDQIEGALNRGGQIKRNDTLVVGDVADFLINDGVSEKPLAIPLSIITKAKNGKDTSHSISEPNLKKLDIGIQNANLIIDNPTRNALVYITDIVQNEMPILVSFQKNATFDGDNVHQATSIHLQANVETMLKALPTEATVYVINKNELYTEVGVTNNLRSLAANVKFIDSSITDGTENVNKQFSVSDKSITNSELNAIQSIGRKSVNNFTSEDIKKTERFARRYFKEMGVKSPFFRAWFGDWRAYDNTKIEIASKKGSDRGVQKNTDTGWNINVSAKVFNETRTHRYNDKSVLGYLPYINDIVEKSILLDSYGIGKAKSVNSVMMHTLYCVSDIGNGKELLKLYVDEINNPNSYDTTKRAYQLQNIEKASVINGEVQDKIPSSHANTTDAIRTISDLVNVVKAKDKNYNPKPVNPVLLNTDGTPKVFYHGTSENFTEFKPEEMAQREGSYFFAENREDAAAYGKNIYEVYLTGENFADYDNQPSEFYRLKDKRAQVEWLKERGYDGWYAEMDSDGWGEISVFNPTQIKSATANIGTFDGNNPDIRYSISDNDIAPIANKNGKLVVINKNKADQMLNAIGIQPSEASRIVNLAKSSLSQDTENVNKQFSLSQADNLDNVNKIKYNDIKESGESYARTDEFRKLQAESRKMPFGNNELENSNSLNAERRERIKRVLRGELESRRNSGRHSEWAFVTYNGPNNTQFNIYENVDAQTFKDIFEIVRKYTGNGELVDLHDVKTTDDGIGYEDCYNYLSDDGLSGFSITSNGDLISVFNCKDFSGKGGFLKSIASTVKVKAKTLDCYASPNQNLMEMYQKIFGFKTASVMDYNMEYDHDNIAENYQSPQVAFMVNTSQEIETKHFSKDDYEAAVEYRNSFIEDNKIAPIKETASNAVIINKLTNKEISLNTYKALERLENGEAISSEEISELKEIKEGKCEFDKIVDDFILENPELANVNRIDVGTYLLNSSERNQLRERIIAERMQEGSFSYIEKGVDGKKTEIYNGVVNKDKRLDIVIGLPASGKFTAIVNPLSEYYKSAVIDSDIIKQRLPEYNEGWGASLVHEESSLLNDMFFNESLAEDKNIVLPIVGSKVSRVESYIKQAKRYGYSVYVHLNELPSSKAIGRMIKRYFSEGRFIDPAYALEYGNKPTDVYEKIKKKGDINGYSRWNNDVERGQRPREIEVSTNIRAYAKFARTWRPSIGGLPRLSAETTNQKIENQIAPIKETSSNDDVFFDTENVNKQFSLSQADNLDNVNKIKYNDIKESGESYARTDEFRKLQAEVQGMSDEIKEMYRSGDRTLDEGLRQRFSRSVKGLFLDSGNNVFSNGNGVLTFTDSKTENQFNIYQNVNGELFHDVFEMARSFLKYGELVDLHETKTTEDAIGYDDCMNYLSEDGLSGFSITPYGDLISVFNASGKNGFLRAISNEVKEKAITLDCYASDNQNLQEIYSAIFGFKTASVMDYNMEYDHDNIAENHQSPQVAFMVNTSQEIEAKHFGRDDYETAVEYRNSFIEDNQIAPVNETSSNDDAFFDAENTDNDVSLSKAQIDYITTLGKRLGRKVVVEDLRNKVIRGNGERASPDGFIDRNTGVIHINRYAKAPITFIFKHELTHFCERSSKYKAFANQVKNSSIYTKWLTDKTGEKYLWDAEDVYIKKLFKGHREITDINDPRLELELIADFVGDCLFTGDGSGMTAIIADVPKKQRPKIIQFVLDFISYLKNKLLGNNNITFRLSVLEDSFNRMLSDATNGEYKYDGVYKDGDIAYCILICKDEELIAKAEQMEGNGASQKEIWSELNVIRNPYAEWVYDIGTYKYGFFYGGYASHDKWFLNKYKLEFSNDRITGKLGHFMRYKKLFAAYEKLKFYSVVIEYVDVESKKNTVYFDADKKTFYIDKTLYDKARIDKAYGDNQFRLKSELLRQLQIAVMGIEGHSDYDPLSVWKQREEKKVERIFSKYYNRYYTAEEMFESSPIIYQADMIVERYNLRRGALKAEHFNKESEKVIMPDYPYERLYFYGKGNRLASVLEHDKISKNPKLGFYKEPKYDPENTEENFIRQEAYEKEYESYNPELPCDDAIFDANPSAKQISDHNSKALNEHLVEDQYKRRKKYRINEKICAGNSGYFDRNNISEPINVKTIEEKINNSIGKDLSGVDTAGRILDSKIKYELSKCVFKNEDGKVISFYRRFTDSNATKKLNELDLEFGSINDCLEQFFDDKKERPGSYNGTFAEYYLNSVKPLVIEANGWNTIGILKILREQNKITEAFYDRLLSMRWIKSTDRKTIPTQIVAEKIKSLGYDSIVYLKDSGKITIMPLYSEIIIPIAENGITTRKEYLSWGDRNSKEQNEFSVVNILSKENRPHDFESVKQKILEEPDNTQKLKFLAEEMIPPTKVRKSSKNSIVGSSGLFEKGELDYAKGYRRLIQKLTQSIKTPINDYDTAGRKVADYVKQLPTENILKNADGEPISLFLFNSNGRFRIKHSKLGLHLSNYKVAAKQMIESKLKHPQSKKSNLEEYYVMLKKPYYLKYGPVDFSPGVVALEMFTSMPYNGDTISYKELERLTNLFDPFSTSATSSATTRLKKILKKHGYDSIVYMNTQDDPGSLSAIIFDERQLIPVSVNGLPMEEYEGNFADPTEPAFFMPENEQEDESPSNIVEEKYKDVVDETSKINYNKDEIIDDGSHIENGKLKPNVKYKCGEYYYIYQTDYMGRTFKVRVDDLQLTEREKRNKHNPKTLGKQKGDHAGHLIGDRFGGSAELDNLVSQRAFVNLSEYKIIENKWANAIKQGKKVSVDITIAYEGSGMRPSGFEIRYSIDGETQTKFINN